MSETESDAVVVGGGLAGLAAAVAVAKAGLSVIHIVPKGPPDRRTSALMRPAVAYLKEAGLVPDPAAIGHPLTQIRIIDATKRLIRAPETLFDSAESGLDAFGWNFPNVKLDEAFEAARASLANLTTIETTLEDMTRSGGRATLRLANGQTLATRLVVGADGKKSRVRETGDFRAREHGFTQAALVCDLSLARPIGGTSIEFHYEQGPFTLVPAGANRANLVWIDDREALKAAQALAKEELAALLRDKAQRLFGTIELLTPTHMFLLSTLTVEMAGHDGVVLVGEAAHAFPPIGAQGLNLSLRDVADLAGALTAADRSRPDFALTVADDYACRRASDLAQTSTMVDTLFRSLLAGFLPVQLARSTGLWALKLMPALRKTAFDIGMGAR